MIIVAKFASVCPCCNARIAVGSKVEWSRGEKARHVACAVGPAVSPAVWSRGEKEAAISERRSSYGRGVRTGCSCGSRELPDGSISSNACASCRFDHDDC